MEGENTDKLPASVTAENLAVWRNKYKKIKSITIEDDGEFFTGFFRRPDITIMSMVMKVAKEDEMKAAVYLFDNCWLGGDETMKEDFAIKMAAMGRLQALMEAKVVEVKNW